MHHEGQNANAKSETFERKRLLLLLLLISDK